MILPLHGDTSPEHGGGKGANLSRLMRAGVEVPPGFILTTQAYRDHLAANHLDHWILGFVRAAPVDDSEALERTSAAIRDRITAAAIDPRLADAVLRAYAALGRPPVAVRSSATTEDLPDLSFAGQQDTLLNVTGDAGVLRAVAQCWSSLWTARAIAYRTRHDIAHEDAALAVVVQRMVPSEVAGVLFTANPLTGKRSEMVIESAYGLGDALVSGRVEPDRYIVDAPTQRVLARHAGAARGETLTDNLALELAGLGQRVATLFDAPQDIEWARAGGRFYVVQSRPITSLFPLPGAMSSDGLRVLMSVGAFQGMLDPFTPLGSDLFTKVLPSALASVGVPVMHAGPGPFVLAAERIFVDLTAMARRPGIRRLVREALRAIEPTTGSALDQVLPDIAPTPLRLEPWLHVGSFHVLWLLSRAVGNAAFNSLWPDRGRARIQQRIEAVIEEFERRGARAADLTARLELLEGLFREVFRSLLPRLLPGFGTGLANLRLLAYLTSDLPDGLQRVLELTRGLPHNVTTEMDLALWEVASVIRRDPSGAGFRDAEAGDLARALLERRLSPAAQAAIDGFLLKYGMRGVAEIDIGRPRWRDDPTALMQALQGYLQIEIGERSPDAVFRRGAQVAESTLASLIADAGRTGFGWLKAPLIARAARRVRALAGLRETPKFTVIRMLGVVRQGLLSSGEEFVARGTIEHPDDLFFLHVDELRALASGEARDWRALVRERRGTYARELRRRHVPRVLLSDGRTFYGDDGEALTGHALAGTPVSPGICEGVVRVVADPRTARLAPGEILVCRGTDPAWTPLFLVASGLVTEVGGLITHGAIVAREYGIPAVVGVRDATTRLRTGDRVRLDGSTGKIAILTSGTGAA